MQGEGRVVHRPPAGGYGPTDVDSPPNRLSCILSANHRHRGCRLPSVARPLQSQPFSRASDRHTVAPKTPFVALVPASATTLNTTFSPTRPPSAPPGPDLFPPHVQVSTLLAIKRTLGTDCSEEFMEIHQGTVANAWVMLKDYYIGDLDVAQFGGQRH